MFVYLGFRQQERWTEDKTLGFFLNTVWHFIRIISCSPAVCFKMIPFVSGSQHSINPILNHYGGQYRQSGAPVTLFPLSQCSKKGPHPGRKKDFWAVNTWLLSSLRFYLRLNISTFTCLSVCHPAPTLLSSIPVRLTASRLQISSITHRLQYSTTRLARCRPKSTCMKKSF